MLDQVQAINWIRENIRNFNGDPNKITLFGPGAGAASSGLLALSPLTRSMLFIFIKFYSFYFFSYLFSYSFY